MITNFIHFITPILVFGAIGLWSVIAVVFVTVKIKNKFEERKARRELKNGEHELK